MPTNNGYTFGTDREVLNLKPQEKIYTAKDKSNNGLFLEIRPNGRKTWAYRYTFNAKQEKLTIGRYPDLSLKDARQARDEAANQIRKWRQILSIQKEAPFFHYKPANSGIGGLPCDSRKFSNTRGL